MKTMNSEWLIQPWSKDEFVEKYLEREPLVIQRNQPDFFKDLLNEDDIDYIVTNMDTPGTFDIRLASTEKLIFDRQYASVSRMQNMEVKNRIIPGKLLDIFDKHRATIIIDHLGNIWPSVMKLMKNVNEEYQCSSNCNVYITPSNAQGFEAHYDTHDVFILQVHGRKSWRIYPNPVELPLATQPSVPYNCSDIDPIYQIDVEQGDTLYIPRGFVHEALTQSESSAHVTLGVYTTTWARIVLDAVQYVAGKVPEFRGGFMVDDIRGDVDKEKKLEIIKEAIANHITIDLLEKLSGKYKHAGGPSLTLKDVLNKVSTPNTMIESPK